MRKSTGPVNHPKPLGTSLHGPVHRSPRPLKAIFEDGDVPELVQALSLLPDGVCDLAFTALSERAVRMLASAVQQVAIDTLAIGETFSPECLTSVIAPSKVRVWDFSRCKELTRSEMTRDFPRADAFHHFTKTLLPQLHRNSVTQRILLHLPLEQELMDEIEPFCFDSDNPTQEGPGGSIRSVVLCDAAGRPLLNRDSTHPRSPAANPVATPPAMEPHAYFALLDRLTSAIKGGNAGAVQKMVVATDGLARCSPDQFKECKVIAGIYAAYPHTGAYQAAQVMLGLQQPVVPQPSSQPPETAVAPPSGTELFMRSVRAAMTSNDMEALLKAVRLASPCSLDFARYDINGLQETTMLVNVLKTERIDSLALRFVRYDTAILEALPASRITTLDVFFLRNDRIDHLRYELDDKQFQHLLAFLRAVSANLPRRELVLNPRMLTEAQHQQLTREFPCTETGDDPSYVKGLKFTHQFTAPSHTEPSAASLGKSALQQAVPAPPETQGVEEMPGILTGLRRFIPQGRADMARLLLTRDGRPRPFSSEQVEELRKLAGEFRNHTDVAVQSAAQAVLDFTSTRTH